MIDHSVEDAVVLSCISLKDKEQEGIIMVKIGTKLLVGLFIGILFAACSVKPVGGSTGEKSVFGDTIDVVEQIISEESSGLTLSRVVISEGSIYAKTNDQAMQGYYIVPFSIEEAMSIKGAKVSDVLPQVETSGVSSEPTQGRDIGGYLNGRYEMLPYSEHRSDLVFHDGNSEAHLDLLSIEHTSGQAIHNVYLTDDFMSVYYEVTDLEGNFIQSVVHHLNTNVSDIIAEGDTLSVMDQMGMIVLLDKKIVNNSLSVIETMTLTSEEVMKEDAVVYDRVIANGIVTDPASNTFKFGYDVGIIEDKIVKISNDTLEGEEILDATGFIVAPGFIDMLGFNLSTTVSKYKITDGVTTNLSLHGCTVNFKEFFRAYENSAPQYVNFGGAVFAIKLRGEVGLDYYGAPTQAQIDQMAKRTREEIEAGAVAVAFSPEYYPGTSAEEIKAIMAVAAEYDIPTHFHARYSSIVGEDIGIRGVEEVIGYARELGARVQFMHLHSTGGTGMMDEALQMINEARAEGVQVSFDIYPYDSWASRMNMQRFRTGWQERYGIDYGDLQIAGSGVWVTEENFASYKAQGALAIAYAMDEDEMLAALSEPYAQVGSDGNIEREDMANNHFRGAGTFSRILGKYVREENVFSLMEGLSKMTINSARHLESVSNDMALRGRLQEGMIADITVFDYKTILDQSTPEKPATESIGIEYVLVSGRVGLREGVLDTSVKAGVGIKSDYIVE